MQPDLLSWKPIYPETAGFKERTTSKDAADGIEASGKAQRLRGLVLAWYQNGNHGTADACARALTEDLLSIRPRCSELVKAGKLVRTGERCAMDGGRNGHVLKAVV